MGKFEKIIVEDTDKHDRTILSEFLYKIMVNDVGGICVGQYARTFVLNRHLCCHEAHENSEECHCHKDCNPISKDGCYQEIPHR